MRRHGRRWTARAAASAVRVVESIEDRRTARQQVERRRVEMMRGYAETPRCRRQYLLNYFGEPYEPPCGACDNCESGRSVSVDDNPPIAIGARVRHVAFGAGTVTGYEDGRLTAVYDDAGYRSVLAGDALERGLLAPED